MNSKRIDNLAKVRFIKLLCALIGLTLKESILRILFLVVCEHSKHRSDYIIADKRFSNPIQNNTIFILANKIKYSYSFKLSRLG